MATKPLGSSCLRPSSCLLLFLLLLFLLVTPTPSTRIVDEEEQEQQQQQQQQQRQRRLTPTKDTPGHPGVVEHRDHKVPATSGNKTGTMLMVRCRNYASAYSAAWIAPKEWVVKCPYGNRLTLEWHSHNLYNSVKGASYKLDDKHAFFVNHMSYYEHSIMGHRNKGGLTDAAAKTISAMSNAEERRACALFRRNSMGSSSLSSSGEASGSSPLGGGHRNGAADIPNDPRGRYHQNIIGVVPFYPGTTGNDSETGNAHSVSPAEIKTVWLKATVCSMLAYMGHVLVGVCSEEHHAMAEQALGGSDFRRQVHVRLLDCEKPVYLPYVLLRTVQQHLGKPIPNMAKPMALEADGAPGAPPPTTTPHLRSARTWREARFVYFSEMDNVLHVRDTATFNALVNFMEDAKRDDRLAHPTGYVSPNRMNKRSKMDPADVSDKAFLVNGQNKCPRPPSPSPPTDTPVAR
jgi:hypothetical protein